MIRCVNVHRWKRDSVACAVVLWAAFWAWTSHATTKVYNISNGGRVRAFSQLVLYMQHWNTIWRYRYKPEILTKNSQRHLGLGLRFEGRLRMVSSWRISEVGTRDTILLVECLETLGSRLCLPPSLLQKSKCLRSTKCVFGWEFLYFPSWLLAFSVQRLAFSLSLNLSLSLSLKFSFLAFWDTSWFGSIVTLPELLNLPLGTLFKVRWSHLSELTLTPRGARV